MIHFWGKSIGVIALAMSLTFIVSGDSPPPKIVQQSSDPLPDGWTSQSPRDEIRPQFSFMATGGIDQSGFFEIRHDDRPGLSGWVQKSFPVQGGTWYSFEVRRQCTNVPEPRRSAYVRIVWQDEQGNLVQANVTAQHVKMLNHTPTAEPDFPADIQVEPTGWTKVGGVYQAPQKATRAIIEMHLQWAPKGAVAWSNPSFHESKEPERRIVRLATVHYKPSGKSIESNREEMASMIAEASKQRADLVVLGETLPTVGIKDPKNQFAYAEAIPGPSTTYFGLLAKKHQLHIVFSLFERDQHLVYNSAVLLGRDGRLIGKYRKVCLPHSEIERGIAPGHDYPVFQTKIGKIGMMVCYDGFYPEVARELSNRGAEVIAWPVWGCNPLLAKARAAENRVYVVSSTFTESKNQWMISAVFDQAGQPIAHADKWGTVATAEVDLSQPYIGPWNLGNFHDMIPHHRPAEYLPNRGR